MVRLLGSASGVEDLNEGQGGVLCLPLWLQQGSPHQKLKLNPPPTAPQRAADGPPATLSARGVAWAVCEEVGARGVAEALRRAEVN